MNVSIVIPCFNERDSIAALERDLFPVVERLKAERKIEVLLVDDGSSDGTVELLRGVAERHPEVRVLTHAQNQGLGAATRTGFASAQGEVVVVTDSDGTYPFTEIPDILALLTPGTDVVTASPYHPGGAVEGVPGYRILLSKGASLLYRLLLRWDVHTYTAMFRAYRIRVVKQAPSSANGFLMPAELLCNAILAGYKVVEYPTVLHVRRNGQSKAKVAGIIRAHLRFQSSLVVRRVQSARAVQRNS